MASVYDANQPTDWGCLLAAELAGIIPHLPYGQIACLGWTSKRLHAARPGYGHLLDLVNVKTRAVIEDWFVDRRISLHANLVKRVYANVLLYTQADFEVHRGVLDLALTAARAACNQPAGVQCQILCTFPDGLWSHPTFVRNALCIEWLRDALPAQLWEDADFVREALNIKELSHWVARQAPAALLGDIDIAMRVVRECPCRASEVAPLWGNPEFCLGLPKHLTEHTAVMLARYLTRDDREHWNTCEAWLPALGRFACCELGTEFSGEHNWGTDALWKDAGFVGAMLTAGAHVGCILRTMDHSLLTNSTVMLQASELDCDAVNLTIESPERRSKRPRETDE
jgi:hypothetical protein